MYVNPYQNLGEGAWKKANFHTHAGTGPSTCGCNPIDEVADIYKRLKYDILCISNHDLYTETAEYGDENFLLVPGVEYSRDLHMLTIGVQETLHEKPHQEAIDLTKAAGGFTVMCHPNWFKKEYWSRNQLRSLTGYTGLEVINMLIYRIDGGSGLATDTWDYLLSNGRLLYGFGDDDLHALFDAGRSFNVIYCKELTFEAMKAAVDAGMFCASTGLFPEYQILDGNKLHVKAKFPVETYVDTFEYRFISENGKICSIQKGSSAEYELHGESYVRVEAVGENGAMLFFQPVYDPGRLTMQ